MSDSAPLVMQAVHHPVADERISLVDLLDRVLATGVVITGDIRLSIADVDLVTISLRALISSIGTAFPREPGGGPPP